MKKLIYAFGFTMMLSAAFGQNDKYLKVMKEKVPAVDTTRSFDGLKDLSASFERIGETEKNQWLPYYYAALTQINSGYMLMMAKTDDLAGKLDPIADKAEALLNKAEALSKDNSEIYVVRKMIATLRMSADPMTRYMQYGPQAKQALDMAKKLNPENPRVYMLEGEDKFFTPEQYGGSKSEAKTLFDEAIKKFDAFKVATSVDPSWGRSTTQYFMSQIK